MKKVLLTSTALVLSAGIAAAEVSVGGDGRMGVIDNFDGVDFGLASDDNIGFTSRLRISFSASGETDGGLSFGGSVRADNAGGGASGAAGSVFAEGTFGRISMGDVDGAAEAAVGYASGVGLTGLGDTNEILYIAGGGPDSPNVLYEYSTGALAFYASADNPGPSGSGDAWAVGASYDFGDFGVAIGYEDSNEVTVNIGPDDGVDIITGGSGDHIVLGGNASFGDMTLYANYGSGDVDGADVDQYSVSLDYTMGATTLGAFWRQTDAGTADITAWGIGAAYDLGGGASLKGGYVDLDIAGGTPVDGSDGAFDFGLSMSF